MNKSSTKEEYLLLFGKNLVKLRKAKNFSQEKLCFETNLDVTTISKIERGLLNISVYNIYKIAKALEIEPKELLDI